MSPQPEPVAGRSEARAERRWLIGIVISVVFGIFGAVMALLAYNNREAPRPAAAVHSAPSTPAADRSASPTPAVAAPPPPDQRGGNDHGKEHGNDHHRGHGHD